jgi:Trk K+ transport system NAD-binding subunit
MQAPTRWQRWRASWRDTRLLLREFRDPLLIFIVAIFGCGVLYNSLAYRTGEDLGSAAEAIYLMLTLAFMQSGGEFPHIWYLQVFYFVMPLIGIGVVAQGLTEFGVMLFNRRARSKEWEMAVASMFSNHVILVGLGHLGFRVAQQLCAMEEDVVVIELNPQAHLVDTIRALGIPVLQGDGTRDEALEAAGVRRARVIVLCTQNDSLNLQMAVKARSFRPDIRVVIRIFDEDFARALQEQFGFQAFSATEMSAPAFAAAAAGVDITHPITVEGQSLSLARLSVAPSSSLVGRSVGDVEARYEMSVVLLRHDGQIDLHPPAERALAEDDVMAVLGAPAQINILVRDNQ